MSAIEERPKPRSRSWRCCWLSTVILAMIGLGLVAAYFYARDHHVWFLSSSGGHKLEIQGLGDFARGGFDRGALVAAAERRLQEEVRGSSLREGDKALALPLVSIDLAADGGFEGGFRGSFKEAAFFENPGASQRIRHQVFSVVLEYELPFDALLQKRDDPSFDRYWPAVIPHLKPRADPRLADLLFALSRRGDPAITRALRARRSRLAARFAPR